MINNINNKVGRTKFNIGDNLKCIKFNKKLDIWCLACKYHQYEDNYFEREHYMYGYKYCSNCKFCKYDKTKFEYFLTILFYFIVIIFILHTFNILFMLR